MDNGRKEYIFFWFIENYSYCSHNNGEDLVSPTFIVDELEGTAWTLHLCPRRDDDDARGHISLFLNRNEEDDGPENISLNYELSFLAADGSAFCWGEVECELKNGNRNGYGKFLKTDEILLQRKGEYLLQDILTVRCKIRKGEGNVQHIGQSSARTRIRVEKNSFLHLVENFSTLQRNVKYTTKIPSHSKKECFISSTLYFTEGLCGEEKVMIEIVPSDTDKILLKCELFLLDGSGNVIECGGTDNRYDAELKSIHTTALSLSRKSILNRKSEYLPDDKLSLICKCTFSSGIEFEATEETINEISSAVMKKSNDAAASVKNELHSTLSSVSEDIKSLYIDQCLTDVELKTDTKSFPAHKLVLCARSPVFKAMMTNDMKEKNTDCINVDDLENDIVQQMLLFLYSDKIDNLQWENAAQLYYAADKYQICKLKEVCSSFLVGNLTTTSAPELLLLADTHSDSNLRKSVEDFILKYEEQIFGSKEWVMLAGKNPQLVINTMRLKYKRKK